jgi:hypothetical protein
MPEYTVLVVTVDWAIAGVLLGSVSGVPAAQVPAVAEVGRQAVPIAQIAALEPGAQAAPEAIVLRQTPVPVMVLQSRPVSQRGASARQAVPPAVPGRRQAPVAEPAALATQVAFIEQMVVALFVSQAPAGATTARQTPPVVPEHSSGESQRGEAERQLPPWAPWATQVEAPARVTQLVPAAQTFITRSGSHAAPAATAVRQRELLEVAEPLHTSAPSQAVPVPRQAPLSAPSAMQVPVVAPVAAEQIEPIAQTLVAPVGSHMPPAATVAISVTESSKVPCAVKPVPTGGVYPATTM